MLNMGYNCRFGGELFPQVERKSNNPREIS